MVSWPPGGAGRPGCGCCSRSTGWLPSIPFRPRSTTSGRAGTCSAPIRGRVRGRERWPGTRPGEGGAVSRRVPPRDAGQSQPAAAVLMPPTVDLTSSGASMTERVEQDPFSTPALLRQLAADYLGGADPKTPLASPLFASLAGLPPLLILVGTADLLLSDSARLAAD